MRANLVEQCYKKSIELLLLNSTNDGFLAATPKGKAILPAFHYDWIFGRDSSICLLGAVASGRKDLLLIARNNLITLSRYQTKQGQIPNAVNVKNNKAEYYFMSSVDGTLWWLISLKFYHNYSGGKKLYKRLNPKIKKAITWLDCQTGGTTNLITQAGASDWADLMPSSGHVLYSNILWYWVQELYCLKDAKLTKSGINSLFYPFNKRKNSIFYQKNFLYCRQRDDIIKKIKPTNYYLNYIKPYSSGRHCDVYANSLSILLSLPDKNFSNKIINYFLKQRVNKIYPAQVLTPPISKKDKEWDEIMERRNMNFPCQYHNGGIWPYVGGFWIMSLYKMGRKKLAFLELEKLALANKANNWQFNEWLHGKTGKPMGMAGQTWNAGIFILAYHYLKDKICLN